MRSDAYECPLLNHIITDGLCYDIQMIRIRAIKAESITEIFNHEDSDKHCPTCEFNQFLSRYMKYLQSDMYKYNYGRQ